MLDSIEKKPAPKKGKDGCTQGKEKKNNWVRPLQKFQGEYKNLSGYIFDYGIPNQADAFTATLKKLWTYISCSCKDSHDIRVATEILEDVRIPLPCRHPNTRVIESKR
mmetsp:Transcript_8147/g.17704  ORF Transcript_8147/g.17704 Transcript_8147/m.17704 type:complete len:108 (-) Transcript_8147:668-991(-)